MGRDGFSLMLTVYERLFTFAPGAYSEADFRVIAYCLMLLIIAPFIYERVKGFLLSRNEFTAASVYAMATLFIAVLSPGSASFIYFVF
jgi:hypothetical protein